MQQVPLSFDVVEEKYVHRRWRDRTVIPYAMDPDIECIPESQQLLPQAPYNYGSVQSTLRMDDTHDFLIVPSLFKRGVKGAFQLRVHANRSFKLELFDEATLLAKTQAEYEASRKLNPNLPRTKLLFDTKVEEDEEKGVL